MTINEIIKNRRTIRKFKQTPLYIEQIESYIDAARVAPSAANLQPLKYVAVCRKEMVDKIFPLLKWAGYLAPAYNPEEGERPVAYVIVCADTHIRKEGFGEDVGAAVENMILSALCDGVGSCWLGSIDRMALKELLQLPDNFIISSVIALGYPAESPKEAQVQDESIKYYLEDGTLNVPKRSLEDVIFKSLP